VLECPIQRNAVGAGLAAGNDGASAAEAMEHWSVGVLQSLYNGPPAGLPGNDQPFIVLYQLNFFTTRAEAGER
jgi:hypothetical protein